MGHLTLSQRYTISEMNKQGFSQIDISKIIGKHKSVVSRELKRNCDKRSGKYCSDLAHRKAIKRQKEKPKSTHFTAEIEKVVIKYLEDDYSPEQISGFMKKHNQGNISHETIYKFVWAEKKSGGSLYKHLRRKGRRYRKRKWEKDSRGIIKNRKSIEKRPKEVENRSVFGDLEGDLIIGKNHNQAIVTINDRSTGMLRMGKVASKEACQVRKVMQELITDWSPYNLRTLTLDNGKEFAEHEILSENIGIDVYFAHPYSPWERGSNENLNGLIRQYFPKGTDFSLISDEQILEIESKLNNRPRKRYNFDSPIVRMENLLFNQKVAFVT